MARRREPGGLDAPHVATFRHRHARPLGVAFGALVVAIFVIGLVTVAEWGLRLLR